MYLLIDTKCLYFSANLANKKVIEDAEVELLDEIRKKAETVPDKRKSVRPKISGKATAKDVSKAVGERIQLSTPEKEAKKRASDAKKAKTAAQKLVEEKQERQLQKSVVSRNLFDPETSTSSKSLKPSHDVMSDDDEASDSDNNDDITMEGGFDGLDDINEYSETNNMGQSKDESDDDSLHESEDTDPEIHKFSEYSSR